MLKYANNDFAFGKHSPLNPTLRGVMYGDADKYMDNKHGYPSDIFPSSKQYRNQIAPETSPARLAARNDYDPMMNKMVQRYRPTTSDCQGDACDWKPVLEDKVCGGCVGEVA